MVFSFIIPLSCNSFSSEWDLRPVPEIMLPQDRGVFQASETL
jgi:hypothetical protein